MDQPTFYSISYNLSPKSRMAPVNSFDAVAIQIASMLRSHQSLCLCAYASVFIEGLGDAGDTGDVLQYPTSIPYIGGRQAKPTHTFETRNMHMNVKQRN